MREIITSATSAPSVFSPYQFTNITGTITDYGSDAGLFVNNSSLQAFLDAKLIYPDQKYIIVSLGTGMPPENAVLELFSMTTYQTKSDMQSFLTYMMTRTSFKIASKLMIANPKHSACVWMILIKCTKVTNE